ncbi:MAG TPA: hypothetical protein VFP72_16990 [Kineosporiaceae bacterium]|nr:hypothetical protein [Kineosporiaceae bacterium]
MSGRVNGRGDARRAAALARVCEGFDTTVSRAGAERLLRLLNLGPGDGA